MMNKRALIGSPCPETRAACRKNSVCFPFTISVAIVFFIRNLILFIRCAGKFRNLSACSQKECEILSKAEEKSKARRHTGSFFSILKFF